MQIVLDAINIALFIAVAALLAGKYRTSRQPGYLWLGVPLILLPFLSLPIAYWIRASVDRLAAGGTDVVYPFTLVVEGRVTLGALLAFWNGVSHVLWSAFVVVGLLMLRHSRRRYRTG